MGTAGFDAIRLAAGAVVLIALVRFRDGGVNPALPPGLKGMAGPLALALYVLGFSFAYACLRVSVHCCCLAGCR
ncbi:MAG: hypothetical protein KAT26_10445 [Marinosulfonomonas sp.]|nr:hypothetical protein [Marinosulfonomonas sp.]